MSSLPFSDLQRAYLASRFLARQPVYGFGRPAFFPYAAFLFFPLYSDYGQPYSDYSEYYAPMVQVQQTVITDNTTLEEASVQVLPAELFGVLPVLVTVPYFETTAFFDPIIAINASDLVVTENIQDAVDDVMAYGEEAAAAAAGGQEAVASAALPRGLAGAVAVLQAVAAAATSAAAVFML